MKEVIILGNDHTNTLGLVQSIGKIGMKPLPFIWGKRRGMIRSCRYVQDVVTGHDVQDCINKTFEYPFKSDGPIPILCGCDDAGIAVDQNKETLKQRFVFEHTLSEWSISKLQEKDLQVRLAQEAGFNVPGSFSVMSENPNMPENIPFGPPYIFKALKSIEGDKGDLTICRTQGELRQKSRLTLSKIPRILVQQYIERDYEVSVLGCALKSGECVMPVVSNKLSLFPKDVGLECIVDLKPLEDKNVRTCIERLIRRIGYVGLFSVELMHCRQDNKLYFTEINLRNDGTNSFYRKYGVNLPAIHVADLLGQEWQEYLNIREPKRGLYIWEMHHLRSMLSRDISIGRWIREILKAKGGLVYDPHDIKPMIMQFSNPLLTKLKLMKGGNY